ncbi:afadin- and alpha-actinin-binding protein isoform X2 [Melanotaenia boesemani]|uniref:afadin- and alpha-actinin-binding protein isoform X2 n=1 Tax=Melanotaenia boesemani TaxID=1250792 RepID=UPI001C03BCF1|nr:afadin- and alpha-actinin-binding protein isoform X2 [Melanotaenia boesemani]
MASRFGPKKVEEEQDYCYSYLRMDSKPLNEHPQSPSWLKEREEHIDQGESLREQLKEMDEHVARLQDMLRCEWVKCSRLQLQFNQQEAELKRRELLSNRLKEKLSKLVDRPRDKGPSLEVLNLPPSGRGKREQLNKSLRFAARREEAALQLMLERREAELREAMKLRHSLTTLLHALRKDMEQSLSDLANVAQDGDKKLDQTEVALGEHVTGGVVQSWRQVQKKLQGVLSDGQTAAGTDHDKLLAQLEAELRGSHQLVRLQQQLLQDSLASPVPSELSDSYFLEEWERLQMCWGELHHQKRTFERERKAFTDAAIRLSHERRDFEQQKASFVKQQYLCDSPLMCKGVPNSSRESTVLNFSCMGPANMSGCRPITPSSADSSNVAIPGLHEGTVRVQTPSTPELYAALNMSDGRSRDVDHQLEMWDSGVCRRVCSPWAQHMDLSF